MKILHIIPYFYPAVSYGGPVNVSYYLTKELRQLNNEVKVLTTDAYDLNKRVRLKKNFINNVEVTYLRNLSNKLAKKYNMYLPLGMVKYFRKNIKDNHIIHIHEYFTVLTVLAVYYACKNKKKIFLQSHGSIVMNTQRGRPLIKNIFNFFFENFLLKNVDHFLVLSDEEMEYLLKKDVLKNKIHFINNGVDISEFDNYKFIDITGRFIKREVEKEHFKLVFLGRINFIKGFDYLIESVSILIKRGFNVLLFIAGDDDGYKIKLEQMINNFKIKENVYFIGFLNKDEKLSLLEQSDIYIQTSISDAFPVSVVEAICKFKPVVITNTIGIARLVDNKFGIVTELDPNKIADAVIELLSDKKLRSKFINNAKQMREQLFSWKSIAQELNGLYATG